MWTDEKFVPFLSTLNKLKCLLAKERYRNFLKRISCVFFAEPRRRNSDSNVSNEGPQTSAVNIPPRANSASHRPYDQLTGSLPNGRSSYESGPNMLRDLGNNGGFLKLDKTGLKNELVAAPQSCTSSRSSSLDRSPTGSIGSITGSIASTESR